MENPVDFTRIIRELSHAGWRERAIAKVVGVTQPNISQIKKGRVKNPKYNVGAALIKLHEQEMPLYYERISGVSSAANEG